MLSSRKHAAPQDALRTPAPPSAPGSALPTCAIVLSMKAEMPKSDTLGWPSVDIRMLAGCGGGRVQGWQELLWW